MTFGTASAGLIRALARSLVAPERRADLRMRGERLVRLFDAFPDRAHGWLVNAFGRSGTVPVGEAELRARRRSDTIYIFGSGYSLSQLTRAEWGEIERHDTMGMSYFVIQKAVRVDYHLVRELGLTSHDNSQRKNVWRAAFAAYAGILRDNPRFRDTVFVVQAGWTAFAGNRLVGLGYLPKGSRLFRYRNGLRGLHPPATGFSQGLTHGPATVTDCVNFAAVAGWRHIVLAGIDLYDRRYFWHAPGGDFYPLAGITDRGGGEYAGEGDLDARHRTSRPMLDWAALWRAELEKQGISLEVLNPKSLLAGVLPVHRLGALPVDSPAAKS
ncbi:MAG: hypothetical protein HY059_16720 [Proteobacteria bacterium]|nr:hypothetical protein [Pseudomonadota bacterium]